MRLLSVRGSRPCVMFQFELIDERYEMNMKTGLLRRVAAVAAFSGVAVALTTGTASAADGTHHNRTEAECIKENSAGASDLSPSSQKAWAGFICGAGQATGGAARMVSGAWVGAPGLILMGATGGELSPAQKKARVNWDGGSHQVGNGAAMPPLAKNVVDQEAVDLLQEYLESLNGEDFILAPAPPHTPPSKFSVI